MENRSVFVIELLCAKPIGKDKDGRKKVVKYLAGLSEVLEQTPECRPSSHLSKKYGIAAWLPLVNGGAIHLYAWDDRTPSFVSVDTIGSFKIRKASATNYTRRFFEVSDGHHIVTRTLSPPPPTWKELAQDVYRQRLTLQAENCHPLRRKQLAEFLPELAKQLEMIPLHKVHAKSCHAWMHWETSGCVISWQNGCLSLDIYTCKRFSEKRAKDFTREFFKIKAMVAYRY